MVIITNFSHPPADQEYGFYRDYVEEKFPPEGPALFGLHNNAEIGFLLASADALFSIVVDISGGTGGGAGSGDDIVQRQITTLERLLPENFDYITLDQRAVERTPYMCVILQEVERMNKLLTEIRRSLTEIGLGLAGALNMSDAMDALAASLQVNRVPSRRPGLIIAHMSIYGNNH